MSRYGVLRRVGQPARRLPFPNETTCQPARTTWIGRTRHQPTGRINRSFQLILFRQHPVSSSATPLGERHRLKVHPGWFRGRLGLSGRACGVSPPPQNHLLVFSRCCSATCDLLVHSGFALHAASGSHSGSHSGSIQAGDVQTAQMPQVARPATGPSKPGCWFKRRNGRAES